MLISLRRATRELHDRLETRLGLVESTLDLARYRRILLAFHGYYAPLEERLARIEGWAGLGVDYASRRKAHLIDADLRGLGAGPDEIAAAPICGSVPCAGVLPAALGHLYVTEGATLGGRVISRVVHETLGVTPPTGGSFFHGYGASTDAMWRGIVDTIAGVPQDPDVERAIVAAALATFETLEQWLHARGTLHEHDGRGHR